ncbi:MAG: aspartate--tRNA ligase [Bacteroidia bacterium]
MLRTHTCGELRSTNIKQTVTLTGWVQSIRLLGGLVFIDLRDRYGITQISAAQTIIKELGKEVHEFVDEHSLLNDHENKNKYLPVNYPINEKLKKVTREAVIQVTGVVKLRESINSKIETGEIEVIWENNEDLVILNEAITPPFTIEENTDGGRANLQLRHKVAQQTRNFLDAQEFIEVETPVLIKSTPEGARDFVVPSRMNPGEFYALPQSPQTFKQLLMVSGFDRYYQIVKCFRDEDLRADRQPEFTQIDCEMSFVEQEDILNMFEGLVKHLFKNVKGIDIESLPRMTYADAMKYYGSDKPDTRFEMKFVEVNDVVKGKNFPVFDNAELVVGICAKGCAEYTRKQLDELTDFVKRPQIGATGLVYARVNADGSIKSSVDKFYDEAALKLWAEKFNAQPGDLILLLAGQADKTRKALNELRLEMGTRLGLRDKNTFSCLWVVDFPLLEFNEDENRYFAMHHPFTSPKPEDIHLLNSFETLGQVRANAYDMVINGVEVGGGSVRIFNKDLQARMFEVLGFTAEEAQHQFGFLMDAFQYGAPPHAGIAFGFDRLCSLFGGADSIRDFIAFPKNNSGRDVMIDAPSTIDEKQLNELNIAVKKHPSTKQESNDSIIVGITISKPHEEITDTNKMIDEPNAFDKK